MKSLASKVGSMSSQTWSYYRRGMHNVKKQTSEACLLSLVATTMLLLPFIFDIAQEQGRRDLACSLTRPPILLSMVATTAAKYSKAWMNVHPFHGCLSLSLFVVCKKRGSRGCFVGPWPQPVLLWSMMKSIHVITKHLVWHDHERWFKLWIDIISIS